MNAGDVLVVGAGASGLLIAAELLRRGISATVIDAVGAGAEQSGHHHGLLHHGSLYVGNSQALIERFAEGRELWSEWLTHSTPMSTETVIPVWDPLRKEQAIRWWEDSHIKVWPRDKPEWLRGAPTVFESQERTYDFSSALALLCDDVLAGHTRLVKATELEHRNGVLKAVLGTTELGEPVRITAGRFVLAAGAGLVPLLTRSHLTRGRLICRTSFMLVVEAENLPEVGMICVDQETGGLFTGVRQSSSGTKWLVGDHLSLGGAIVDSRSQSQWVHAAVETLREWTTLMDSPGVKVGAYPATKAELRDDPNDLSPFGIESYGLSNAIVVTPTKITLAPVMARRAAEVIERLRPGRPATGDPLDGAALSVCQERWMATATFPLEEIPGRFPV